MSSKDKWKSYDHGFDDLTKTGNEIESWGKRSSRKDLHERFLQTKGRDQSVHNDIAGFSSSDEDDELVGFTSARKLSHLSASKRTLTAKQISNAKRQKYDQEYSKPLSYFPQRTFNTTTTITLNKAPDIITYFTPVNTTSHRVTLSSTPARLANSTRSSTPVNTTSHRVTLSSTPARLDNTTSSSTPVNTTSYRLTSTTLFPNCPGTDTPLHHLSKSTTCPSRTPHLTPPTSYTSRSRNFKKWKLFSNNFESSFIPETPRTSKSAKEDINSDINWSDSDSEDRNIGSTAIDNSNITSEKIPFSVQSVNKQQVHGIGNIDEYESDSELSVEQLDIKENSANISPMTSSPSPCTPTKCGDYKPPMDSSKKGKKKYLRGGLAERLHKLIRLENSNRSLWLHKTQRSETDKESPDEGTVTVRVLSERLDHSVYILTCHVLSQDGSPPLPKNLTVLLENQRRKNLNISGTSSSLKIFSPWKLLHLPGMSVPLLMNMAHCEVISSSSIDFIPEDISQSFDEKQVETAEVVRLEKIGETSTQLEVKNSHDDEIIRTAAIDWSLMDFTGYEGVFLTRVNVTGRVQRTYWRYLETKDHKLNSGSSITASIIQNAKILGTEKHMSLCCLIQGLTNVCCEVILRKELLLKRTDWIDVLSQSEGSVLFFSNLRLVEHRSRKRAHQLFSLIDSLKRAGSKQQQSCFVFVLDDQSTLENASDEQDYPKYFSHEDVDDKDCSVVIGSQRVSFCGRILHVRLTNDKYYNTKHIRLWCSVKTMPQTSNTTSEPSVIQVRYFSGRPVEWNALSTLLSGQMVSMKDLVLEKENPMVLKADIFSKIQVIIPESSKPDYDKSSQTIHQIWQKTMTKIMKDEDFTRLKSLPVANLQSISENCLVDTLVIFEGTVTGIDHDNAFCWYTCPSCNTEDIIEISPRLQYECCACSLRFNSPVKNIHLEVYLKSSDTPTLKIKMKLLQETTKRLLSGSEKKDKQTYDVNSVLNKHLGPMPCLIVERIQDKDLKIRFTLEEIDCSDMKLNEDK